jgi:hypothetical protein
MKVFIWERIEKLTDNYHSDGGLVVVAANLQRAVELAEAEGVEFSKGDYDELTPSNVYNTDDSAKEKVFIFPDAGCC